MDFEDKIIIGLVVSLQEQSLLLMQCIESIKSLLEEEDHEDIILDNIMPIPRRVWAFNRYGRFWENDVHNNNENFFKESFRVERNLFAVLVQKLKVLEKKNTRYRRAIPLEKRIAIALYTLGSSSEYRTIGSLFGVSANSVCDILHEFCRAIIAEFSAEYIPSNFLTEAKVDECVKGFEAIGFPQCLGVIDGCHIAVKPHAAEAVDYYNYKGWYSVVLFALVDFRHRFLYVNVGCPGRCNDSQIYRQSQLSKMIESSTLLKEKARNICGTQVPVLLVGDSAFKFSSTLMKPYPSSTTASIEQQMFNYNLSKARSVVDNAFGHLKARFRRIGQGLDNQTRYQSQIIMCCCILHNFLNCHNSTINESWKTNSSISQPQPEGSNISGDWSAPAESIRRALAKFIHERDH